jgi:hypothetical protein
MNSQSPAKSKPRPTSAPSSALKPRSAGSSPQRVPHQHQSWVDEKAVNDVRSSVDSLQHLMPKTSELPSRSHSNINNNKSPPRHSQRESDMIHRDQVSPGLAKTLDHIIGQVLLLALELLQFLNVLLT